MKSKDRNKMLAKRLISIIIILTICSCIDNNIQDIEIEEDLAIITINWDSVANISIRNVLANTIIKEIKLPDEIINNYNNSYEKIAENFWSRKYYELLYQFYNDNIYIFDNSNGTNIFELNIYTEKAKKYFYSEEEYEDFQIIDDSIFLLHYDERNIDNNYFIEYDLLTENENKTYIKFHSSDFAIDLSKKLICVKGFKEEVHNPELYLYNIQNKTLEPLNIKTGYSEIDTVINSTVLDKGQTIDLIDLSSRTQETMPFDELFDGIIVPNKYFIFEQWNNSFFSSKYVTTFYISRINEKKKYYLFKSDKKLTIIGYINYDVEN